MSAVDVSMNGIELQDREFFAAIEAGREPNAACVGCSIAIGCCTNWSRALRLRAQRQGLERRARSALSRYSLSH